MKKFFKLGLILTAMLFTLNCANAKDSDILVLPDNIDFHSTNYYVYPDASIMFATEVVDKLNHSGQLKTVSMVELRKKLREDLKFNILAKQTLKEFKYNYNINFVDLKKIGKRFGVDKILVITSTTDVQNYFLRRTIWDFLNIPGCSVVDPAYKVQTFVAMVDLCEEKILWQHTYSKLIKAIETRIMAVNFAPASEQLDRLKAYSTSLAPDIASHVEEQFSQSHVTPVEDKKQVEAKVLPINQVKEVVEVQKIEDINIKELNNKRHMPKKPKVDFNSPMINDL